MDGIEAATNIVKNFGVIGMNSSEAIAKIQELQDIYGDIEILVNAQGSDNGFSKLSPVLKFKKACVMKMAVLLTRELF